MTSAPSTPDIETDSEFECLGCILARLVERIERAMPRALANELASRTPRRTNAADDPLH
jgi:hypothetical protein